MRLSYPLRTISAWNNGPASAVATAFRGARDPGSCPVITAGRDPGNAPTRHACADAESSPRRQEQSSFRGIGVEPSSRVPTTHCPTRIRAVCACVDAVNHPVSWSRPPTRSDSSEVITVATSTVTIQSKRTRPRDPSIQTTPIRQAVAAAVAASSRRSSPPRISKRDSSRGTIAASSAATASCLTVKNTTDGQAAVTSTSRATSGSA